MKFRRTLVYDNRGGHADNMKRDSEIPRERLIIQFRPEPGTRPKVKPIKRPSL